MSIPRTPIATVRSDLFRSPAIMVMPSIRLQLKTHLTTGLSDSQLPIGICSSRARGTKHFENALTEVNRLRGSYTCP